MILTRRVQWICLVHHCIILYLLFFFWIILHRFELSVTFFDYERRLRRVLFNKHFILAFLMIITCSKLTILIWILLFLDHQAFNLVGYLLCFVKLISTTLNQFYNRFSRFGGHFSDRRWGTAEGSQICLHQNCVQKARNRIWTLICFWVSNINTIFWLSSKIIVI